MTSPDFWAQLAAKLHVVETRFAGAPPWLGDECLWLTREEANALARLVEVQRGRSAGRDVLAADGFTPGG